MAAIKTRGIVIRERAYSEQDKILTLFTEQEGKIQAIAKGARRRKSTLGAATQLFTYCEFVYWPSKNLATINQAEVIESYYKLSNDLYKMALASYGLELLDAFYELYQGDVQVLKMVSYILYYLSEDKAAVPEALILSLQLKLCYLTGIAPAFFLKSNASIPTYVFEVGEETDHHHHYVYQLTVEDYTMIQETMKAPINTIRTKHYPLGAVKKISSMINHYIGYSLDRRMKSWEFYKEIGETNENRE